MIYISYFLVGSCLLEEGDTIVFGHKSGESFLPGKRVRQPNSPFQFMVCLIKYCMLVSYLMSPLKIVIISFD